MAVFTRLKDEELLDILANFDIYNVKNVEGIIKGSENTNYYIDSSLGRYVLTIFEERTKASSVPFVLDVLHHLNEKNVICPRIITTLGGKRRIQLEDGKTCVLQTYLDGEDIEYPSQLQCYAAGKTLGTIHQATSDMELPFIENSMDVDSLKTMVDELKEADMDEEQKQAYGEIVDEINNLNSWVDADLPKGFIHGDYFKDNVLFTETLVSGVIDFWFACVDSYAYDLAIALNAWGFVGGHLDEIKFHSFLEGYVKVRPLSDLEKQELPRLMRLASLRFFLSRFYDQIQGKSTKVMANKPFQTWQKRLQYHQDNRWSF